MRIFVRLGPFAAAIIIAMIVCLLLIYLPSKVKQENEWINVKENKDKETQEIETFEKSGINIKENKDKETQEIETFEKTGLINKVYKVEGGKTSTTMMMVGGIIIPLTTTNNMTKYYIQMEGKAYTADKELWDQLQEQEGEFVTVQFNQNLHIMNVSDEGSSN